MMFAPCIFFLLNVNSIIGVNVTVRVTDIDEDCDDFFKRFEVSIKHDFQVSVKPNPILISHVSRVKV